MKIKPSKREVKSFRNKYLALTIISLLFFGISQAQYLKPNNSYGTISNRQSIDSTLLIPTGCGDPSLRGVDLKKVALYADTCNNLLYKYNPVTTTWSVIGSNTTLTDGLVSGGIVTWSGQGLKFYVGPAVYILGGKYYYSNLDSVTLAAAPTSDSRIDLIGVDTSRHAFVDTGVVSATPIVPQAQVGVQIPLTTGILINAGDTIPSNVIVTMVYNENLGEPDEWSTHTENAPITADFNNTVNPKKGTKDVFISRYNSQSIVYFATSTPYTLSSDAVLLGWIFLNKRLVNTIYAFLYNSTTGAKTNAIPLSLDRFDSTSYQQFVLPTSNFTWTGNTNNQFNTIEFYFSGNDTTDLKGLRMDWITLQKGIQSVPPQIDYSNKLDSVFLSNDSLFQYVKGVKLFRGLATGSSGSDSSAYSSATSVNDSTWSLNAKNGTKTFFQLTQSTTGIVGDTVKFTNPNFVKKSDKFPIGTIKPILALNDTTLAFDSLNLTEIRYSLAARDTSTWKDSTLIDKKYLNARIAAFVTGSYHLPYNGISTNYLGGDTVYHPLPTIPWTLSGSNVYYNSGNVLIGTSTDDGHKLRVNGTVSLNLGSDAPGDTYYRDSLGTFSRLAAPTGFTKPVLGFANGYPKWQADSTGGGTNPTLSTLTDAGTITWNYLTQGTEAKVTLGGNRTLSITNLPTTVTYFTLTVIQDATGTRTLTLPVGTKVINSGAGVVTLSTAANAQDILSFRWDGTTLFCTYGKSYN